MMRMSVQTQALLAALLADPSRERYGLDLSKEAGLPSGTIYPILARLEASGWIDSEWEDIDPVAEGRRPRRYYRLTGEGEAAARSVLEETARRLTPALGPGFPLPGMAQ
jgi:PadR family transcriptional regulator, regulatory protein PadR